MQLFINHHQNYKAPLLATDAAKIGRAAHVEPLAYLQLCPQHKATPLYALPGLAQHLGLGGIYGKDEGQRLGLGSFKALGGAYAVMRLLREQAERVFGRKVVLEEILLPEVRKIAAGMTVACATDGNHGRSVAAGARLVGCRAVISVHSGVSERRIAAIAAYGAEIVRVDGSYDHSVDTARAQAEANGWTIVSDTSWPGYEEIPSLISQGYTVLADEAISQLDSLGVVPTHMFLQAGVGGFAAAMAGHMTARLGDKAPVNIIVEPENASCILASMVAGKITKVDDSQSTLMAMLECFEPSLVAMRVLERCGDVFIAIPDSYAADAMKTLAFPLGTDPSIVSGESGGAGRAGLLALLSDDGMRSRFGLNAAAHVLLINTEGASDEAQFKSIVGCVPADIANHSVKEAITV